MSRPVDPLGSFEQRPAKQAISVFTRAVREVPGSPYVVMAQFRRSPSMRQRASGRYEECEILRGIFYWLALILHLRLGAITIRKKIDIKFRLM
ncbi:hypothetical protein GSU3602 [Geobacter sulfurreducens PCA]|uniref:Uncharacterized protein n=1 Tax=Geobacter sulfurreducens (strain ATCC 51573 / DSM 12127 / PCA) TaxID=243231 RepID=I7EPC6_GEOSL|nr:hypothetical protein KN400_3503 [Geobacter sulfurreducens KN400]AFP20495.1 hypothetical protein GSU3602 [Geobacter sulfurreducens PCA]AJY68910.1 hypothetical protein RW64_04495 [Geobacter sulfurreducens]HBB68772.1 hypothetical protein [Geobacter sulfurreducens]HCD94723.1 hypothetical protein [Geobacter sulfurreducens]